MAGCHEVQFRLTCCGTGDVKASLWGFWLLRKYCCRDQIGCCGELTKIHSFCDVVRRGWSKVIGTFEVGKCAAELLVIQILRWISEYCGKARLRTVGGNSP